MSRPNQVRIMLVLAFVLTLIAGAVVGAGLVKSSNDTIPPPSTQTEKSTPGTNPTTQSTRRSRDWFADRLQLSPAQQEEWSKIWRNSPHDRLRQIGEQERNWYQKRDESIKVLYTTDQNNDRERIYQEYHSKVAELMRDRDKQIDALYTPEQKAERERLQKECQSKVAELKAEREKLLQPLLDKSRQILTEDQRKRFDLMLKGPGPGNMGQGPSMGHRSSPGGPTGSRRGPGTQSATRPSNAPNSPLPADGKQER